MIGMHSKKFWTYLEFPQKLQSSPSSPPGVDRKEGKKKKRKKKSVPIGEMKKSQTYIKYEGSYENQNKHLRRVEKK